MGCTAAIKTITLEPRNGAQGIKYVVNATYDEIKRAMDSGIPVALVGSTNVAPGVTVSEMFIVTALMTTNPRGGYCVGGAPIGLTMGVAYYKLEESEPNGPMLMVYSEPD